MAMRRSKVCKHKMRETVFNDRGEWAAFRCQECKELLPLAKVKDRQADLIEARAAEMAFGILADIEADDVEVSVIGIGQDARVAVGGCAMGPQEADRLADRVRTAALRARMRNTCIDRVAFVDGELDETRAQAFRDHLADCTFCQKQVVEDVQTTARLSTLGDKERELQADLPRLGPFDGDSAP